MVDWEDYLPGAKARELEEEVDSIAFFLTPEGFDHIGDLEVRCRARAIIWQTISPMLKAVIDICKLQLQEAGGGPEALVKAKHLLLHTLAQEKEGQGLAAVEK